jgi:hypothetical protein
MRNGIGSLVEFRMPATSTVFDLDEGGERNVRLRDLQATATVCLVLASGVTATPGFAQQQTAPTQTVSNPTAPAPAVPIQNDTTGNPTLPQAPAPKPTQPLYLRDTGKDDQRSPPTPGEHPGA